MSVRFSSASHARNVFPTHGSASRHPRRRGRSGIVGDRKVGHLACLERVRHGGGEMGEEAGISGSQEGGTAQELGRAMRQVSFASRGAAIYGLLDHPAPNESRSLLSVACRPLPLGATPQWRRRHFGRTAEQPARPRPPHTRAAEVFPRSLGAEARGGRNVGCNFLSCSALWKFLDWRDERVRERDFHRADRWSFWE